MENIAIREISISNLYELSKDVKKALIQCKDIQIFISNKLFARIMQEEKNNIIWEEFVFDSFHYCDKVEQAFLFSINNNKETIQTNFASNCLDYVQLTFFATKGFLYHHYLTGMKQILIFNTD